MLSLENPSLPRQRWLSALALLAIAIVALSLRLYFMRSYFVLSDTASAWTFATAIRTGHFAETLRHQPTHHAMRLPLNFALAIAGGIFDEPRLAIAAVALFFHLGEMIMLYAWGLALGDMRRALLAAALFALYPLAIVEGTQAHIHVLNSFFLTAAALAMYCGLRYARSILLFLAGVLFGLGYVGEITAFFGFVAVLPMLATPNFRCQHLLLPLAGFALVFVGETAIYSWARGELTLRLSLLYAYAHGDYDIEGYSLGAYPSLWWGRYLPGFFGDLCLPWRPFFLGHGLLGWLLCILAPWQALQRQSTAMARLMSWWMLLGLMALNFGCLGFSRPLVQVRGLRFFLFLLAPACLLLAEWLSRLSHRWRLRLLLLIAGNALACCAVLWGVWQPHERALCCLVQTLKAYSNANIRLWVANPTTDARLRVHLEKTTIQILPLRAADDLQAAKEGDLVCLHYDGYHTPAAVPAAIKEVLRQPEWAILHQWESAPNLITVALEYLGLMPELGLRTRMQILRCRKAAANRDAPMPTA